MRVLVVAPTLPHEGVRHAGGLYLLNHLRLLADSVERVVLLCIDTGATADDIARAPSEVELVLAGTGPQAMSRLRRARHRLAARVRPAALGADAVESLLAAGIVELARDADMVELQWPELEVLVPLLRRRGVTTPVAVLEHDLGVEASASRAERGSMTARLVATLLRPLRSAISRRDLNAADLVLVFKQTDVELLRDLGVTTPVEVLDPPLDAAAPGERRPGNVLFTGAMWRPENDEGARWLVGLVWPSVVSETPEASLTIAGAGPSDDLVRLARDAGVEITGDVPDLGSLYARASVFVAPLWVAGGLKFKVAQAMRCGLPVVATTIAAAGIVDEAPPDALWAVTDDPASMAAALVDAIRDPQRAAAVGAAAAVWAAERWSAERTIDLLVARYRHLAAELR